MYNAQHWIAATRSDIVLDAQSGEAHWALDESPSAIVWLEDAVAYLRVSPSDGNGTIHYQGTRHPLNISGVSIIDTLKPRVFATGIAKRLRTLLDFAGHYSTVIIGAARSAETAIAYLRNERGVLIQLMPRHAGIRFGVSAHGVEIRFQHLL